MTTKPHVRRSRYLWKVSKVIFVSTKHRVTNAVAEGTNGKIQLIKANARGYRNFAHYRIAILFHCGGLDLYPAGCVP